MKFILMLIIVLTFNATFLLKAYAVDLTPFHVVSSNKRLLIIDLNKNTQAPKTISIFGQYGWSTATLKEMIEKCEYLCGEGDKEGKECHNEGVYILNKKESYGSLRGPLMAIEGKPNIENTNGHIKFKKAKSKQKHETYISKEFSQGYRWAKDGKSDKTYLFSEYMGPKGIGSKDWYAPPIGLDSCTSKTYKDFEILGCSGVSMLYYQRKLIELSMAEYSSGKLDLKFSININGKTYYAIEVSVKGHGQRLKLITKEGNLWVGFFRAPTYAALC